jgi:hypothetical protein
MDFPTNGYLTHTGEDLGYILRNNLLYMKSNGIVPSTNNRMDEAPTLDIFTEELRTYVHDKTWQSDHDRNQIYMAQALTQSNQESELTIEANMSLASNFQNLMPMQMDNGNAYDPEASLQAEIVVDVNGLVIQPEPTSEFMDEVMNQLKLIREDTKAIRRSLEMQKEVPKKTKRGTRDANYKPKKTAARGSDGIAPIRDQNKAELQLRRTSRPKIIKDYSGKFQTEY